MECLFSPADYFQDACFTNKMLLIYKGTYFSKATYRFTLFSSSVNKKLFIFASTLNISPT
jgi:hypothetical protein